MVKFEFPGFYLPGFKIRKGALLWVNILGVDLIIPPWDITFWEGLWVWRPFVFLDTDLIWPELEKAAKPIVDPFYKAVADAQKAILDPLSKVVPDVNKALGDLQRALLDPMGTLNKLVASITPDLQKWLTPRFDAVPDAVWALFQKTLDDMAREYYEKHSEEEG